MSCNGCRVLRKGCNNDCILRPCLTWISSPESQANATIFLAKFYGRVGLLNLISAGPDHLRPEIFKSLLHEACGRIINPTYGSVGLIRSGNWNECELAVESVLQGSKIMQVINTNLDNDIALMPIESCDIRHLSKETNGEKQDAKIHKKFKRSDGGSLHVASSSVNVDKPVKYNIMGKNCDERHVCRAHTNEHLSNESVEDNLSGKNDRVVTSKSGDGQDDDDDDDESAKALLELTLG